MSKTLNEIFEEAGIPMRPHTTSFERVLMKRDGLTPEEAREELRQCRERVSDGEDPDEILADYGLEPDYVLDIL